MKTSVVSPFVAALLALVIASLTPVSAQTTTATKAKKIPFHGTLQSVDAAAGTVTLASKKEPAGRVFHVQSDTKITDGAGNPSTLSAAVVGEDVGGSYTKDASGNMNLNSVRFGAKDGSTPKKTASKSAAAPAAETAPAPAAATTPAPAPAPAAAPAAANTTAAESATTSTKAKAQRFTGKVVSVDAASNTLVVHGKADQTFTVTSSTKITGAANLGAITAGQKVSGSYLKSTDGATLTVTTLKVTK